MDSGGGCDPNAPDEDGGTALMGAAWNGCGGVVGALLEHGGADLDAADCDGHTPLMCATVKGHAAIARQLVDAGADAALCATDSYYEGKTALEITEEELEGEEVEGRPSCVAGEGQRRAVERGRADIAALLLAVRRRDGGNAARLGCAGREPCLPCCEGEKASAG